jgi:hypothetical protein
LKFKVLSGKVVIFGRSFSQGEKVHHVDSFEKAYEIKNIS